MVYIRMAVLALLAAAIATALFYRGQAISANAQASQLRQDVALAQSVNKQNQATIATLRDDLTVSQALAKELSEQVEQIDQNADARTDARNTLKDTDNEVADYLGAPIPRALQELYAGTDSPRKD